MRIESESISDKLCTDEMIDSMRTLIINRQIQKFLLSKNQPYWTRYKFGKNWYIMDFEYNVYLIL